MSSNAIAKMFGVSYGTIIYRLKIAGIDRRPPGNTYKFPNCTDEIIRLYCDERLPTSKIAQRMGISNSAVRERLLKGGVSLRSSAEAQTGKKLSEAQKAKLSRIVKDSWRNPATRAKMISASTKGKRTPEARDRNSKAHVGMKLKAETKKKLSERLRGPNSYLWKGGLSFEPYCPDFNNSRKECTRERFGRKCFLCGILENGEKLHVHHCDYNKSQGCKGKQWSLIPLCRSCHAKTNHNRWHWFALLRDYWIYEHIDFNSNPL